MGEIGGGSGTSYPATLDSDNSQEINTPNPGRTKARAEVVNDLASAVVAIETELGTDPAGTKTDVKTYLQTEHNADATHKTSLVGMLAGAQTFTGSKTFSATMKLAKGADVASATALALGSDGNYFDITGTTAITSIQTVGVGTVVILHFDGALTLTHHATDLILPGGTSITTAAGDEYMFVEYATGDWRLIAGNQMNAGWYRAGSVGTTALGDGSVTLDKLSWFNCPTIFEDFYGGAQYPWSNLVTAGFSTATSSSVENGVAQCIRDTVTGWAGGWQADTPWKLTAGNNIILKARVKRGSVLPNDICIGLANSATPTTGQLARFSIDGSGYFTCITYNGTPTSNTTDVLLSTSYNTLKIVTNGVTDVKFYIDDVLKFTHTTTIPTGLMGMAFGVNSSDGAGNKELDVDYIACTSDARV